MSELTFTLLRLGYLVLLWVFVLSAVAVLRRDLSPRGAPKASRADRRRSEEPAAAAAPAAPAKQAKSARKGAPTKLVVSAGPLTGTTLPLSAASILIGRAPGCTLVLDDDYSSSRHARIFPQGDQWFVEDLGSTNGTFIGESKVGGPTPLTVGVGVRIGRSVIELQA